MAYSPHAAMRKQRNGLAALVLEGMGADPFLCVELRYVARLGEVSVFTTMGFFAAT